MNVWDLILQMIGCLLVAATIIGLMMGWLLHPVFATSEKRQRLSEIATGSRGREHGWTPSP